VVIALDVDGAVPAHFAAGASPLSELLACLHTLAEPEHHPESRPWLAAVREHLTDPLVQKLHYHAPLWARYRCRLLFPLRTPLDRELTAELDTLNRLDERLFVELAASGIRGTSFAGADNLHDEANRRAFIKASERHSFSRGELARALMDDPASFQTELIATIERCAAAFFDAEWSRIGPRLRDTAAKVRAQLRRESPSTVLISVVPTASVTERPARVRYDKLQTGFGRVSDNGCFLVPTLHGWPHLILKLDPGLPIVVHFAAGDWEQRPALPQSLIRDRLAAIAEPGRFEMCRHLLGEPITTSELAERMGISEPQVSRHLKRLRQVGLVTSRREGRMVYHRLHAQLLQTLGSDVLTTIMR
jgi:DNA-binding transcriptional ArsR family regulator